jgi:FlaA1/EpsC-like NDP-sugar epimerase
MKTRILITGGVGTIGSELVKQLIENGEIIVCVFDNNEDGLFKLDQQYAKHPNRENLRIFLGDIRDSERVHRALEGVDEIYHCAALKHVYLSEYNPFDVIKTNIDGVSNIIHGAINQGVQKVVFTSSDKAVNPTSAMGASKLLGERLVIAANGQVGSSGTRFSCVRFGNVLNSKGSVLKIFEKQFAQKIPLTITSLDMTRYFITMSEAVELCLFANLNMLGGEIFISNMGATDILSLAKAYSKSSSIDYKVIGEKVGEKLYEELITEVELKRAIKFEGKYVVLPDFTSPSFAEKKSIFDSKYVGCEGLKKIMRSDLDLIEYSNLCNLIERVKIE